MTSESSKLSDEVEDLDPRRSMVAAIVGPTLTLLALVALWEFLARWSGIPSWLLPAPSAIVDSMIEWRGELT